MAGAAAGQRPAGRRPVAARRRAARAQLVAFGRLRRGHRAGPPEDHAGDTGRGAVLHPAACPGRGDRVHGRDVPPRPFHRQDLHRGRCRRAGLRCRGHAAWRRAPTGDRGMAQDGLGADRGRRAGAFGQAFDRRRAGLSLCPGRGDRRQDRRDAAGDRLAGDRRRPVHGLRGVCGYTRSENRRRGRGPGTPGGRAPARAGGGPPVAPAVVAAVLEPLAGTPDLRRRRGRLPGELLGRTPVRHGGRLAGRSAAQVQRRPLDPQPRPA